MGNTVKTLNAEALQAAGRYDEARTAFSELLAAYPDDPQVSYRYACFCDAVGEERAAVPLYERSIELRLAGDDLRGALLGLGSTYRCLGDFDKAVSVLRDGISRFPDASEFQVFLAMALHNTGEHGEAVERLLRVVAQTSSDERVRRFERAILFYADKLDQTW